VKPVSPWPDAVSERDDAFHEHGGTPGWREELTFDFADPAAELGLIVRLTFDPGRHQADAVINVAFADGGFATVLARAKVERHATTTVDRIALSCAGPARSWRLACKDTALVLPARGPNAERRGVGVPIEMDVVFDAWVDPVGGLRRTKNVDAIGFVQVTSEGRFEQVGRASGSLRIGEHGSTIDAGGSRMRRWGPNLGADAFLRVVFGPALSLVLRAPTLDDPATGWLARGHDVVPVTAVLETTRDGSSVRWLSIAATDPGGERIEVEGAVLAAHPLRDGAARTRQALIRWRRNDRQAWGFGDWPVAG